jgi:hypothetical protein
VQQAFNQTNMQTTLKIVGLFLLAFLIPAAHALAQCVDPAVVDPAIDCPPVYQPVCGCDEVTYANECEAYYYNGITEWTAGPCPGDTLNCSAFFHVSMIDSVSAVLTNTSIGPFSIFEWAVDGVPQGQDQSPFYLQLEEGFHEICITVWDPAGAGCNSTYCEEVYAGSTSSMCDYTDCVWPGDANGDGAANVYDLLNIGLGYGTVGLERPDAHTEWIGQYAPNWNVWTLAGVDYKHLDCDGDGIVLAEDADAIDANYTPDFTYTSDTVMGAPKIYLEFDVDSIVIDPDSPELVSVTAGLYVGDINNQVTDLHGLALQVYYPQQDLVLPNAVQADYNDNSFLGSTNGLLWMQEDMYNLKRMDLAFSRKAGNGAEGFGRIATAEFIVVSDIIGGRSENTIPFVANLEGVVVVNANGEIMDFTIEPTAEFTIVNNFPTSTQPVPETEKLSVMPNPAQDQIWVRTPVEINGNGFLQVFDTQGQQVQSMQVQQTLTSVMVKDLPRGVYWVQVQTEQGLWTEKVVLR